MKVLLVYPEFPDTFWSFKHALPFQGKRSAFPPLGLLTISAMLPPHWQKRMVDLNVQRLKDSDLAWADVVFFSGRFASSGLDYVKESSITEAGSMAEPEFIFTFVSVGRQPAAAPGEATPPSANPTPSAEGGTQQPDRSNATSEQPTPVQTPAQPSQDGNPGTFPTASPTEQAAPAGARTDNQIQTDVVRALEANSALKDSLITVAIAQGEVTLSGTVPNESCRELAEQIVKYMPGVTKVHNNLRVGISQ